jgi:hypothetical protein
VTGAVTIAASGANVATLDLAALEEGSRAGPGVSVEGNVDHPGGPLRIDLQVAGGVGRPGSRPLRVWLDQLRLTPITEGNAR